MQVLGKSSLSKIKIKETCTECINRTWLEWSEKILNYAKFRIIQSRTKQGLILPSSGLRLYFYNQLSLENEEKGKIDGIE